MEIALTDLDLLLGSAQNCKKCTFLDNLRTITQEGKMESRQMAPFFSSTSTLYMFLALIIVFEIIQNSFSCVHPFGLF